VAEEGDVERKVIRCPRCKRLLAMLRSFGDNPPDLKSVVEQICIPCPVCDGNREGTNAPPDDKPKKVSTIKCVVCGGYLCTIKFLKDFMVVGGGEFIAVELRKCRCKYKNTFKLDARMPQPPEEKDA
jgi:hypothetical protein